VHASRARQRKSSDSPELPPTPQHTRPYEVRAIFAGLVEENAAIANQHGFAPQQVRSGPSACHESGSGCRAGRGSGRVTMKRGQAHGLRKATRLWTSGSRSSDPPVQDLPPSAKVAE